MVRITGKVGRMFDDTRRVDPAVLFPALTAAIDAVPVRPDRDLLASTASAGVTEQARALVVLRRRLDARLLGLLAVIDDGGFHDRDGFPTTTSWLRGYANLNHGQARSLVNAARLAVRLPSMGALVGAGKVGVEHLQAVVAGAARIPDEVLAEHES